MIEVLLLRLDAPLMSFGGTRVDQNNVTGEMPLRSMVTGLLANALGHDHRDFEATERLQQRLRLASRQDRPGERLVDYQTVDLGQDFLLGGWTTRGAPEGRGGSKEAAEGTHIRYRHYLADALYTVALSLAPPEGKPGLDELEAALREPERPLFLGRKACLPSSPLVLGRRRAASLLEALKSEPLVRRGRERGDRTRMAWWPAEDEAPEKSRLVPVFEDRDWRNQIHAGRRLVREGLIEVKEAGDG